jgi:uncharacterized protein (TIGR03083 family)
MDRASYLASLAADSAAFYAAVDATALDAAVPCCPGWTVADLVYHLGEVHHFWGEVVARRLSAPDVDEPERPPDDALVAWAKEQTDRLQEALAATDPATPVWTWSTQKDVGFIQRRMAQETAVHRWDAQSASGTPTAVDQALSVDGIDEFLTYFLPGPGDERPALDGSVHLHVTDGDGEWLVRESDDSGLVVTPEHAKGDAAVRGPASDVLLVLWRRRPLAEVEVLGDAAVAERFVALAELR